MDTRRLRLSHASATPSLAGLLEALGWRTSHTRPDELAVELDLAQDVEAQLAQLRLAVVAWQAARPTIRVALLDGEPRPLAELRNR